MGRSWRGVLLIGVLLGAMVLTGCGREFAPYWKIDKLRLMAIKADPVVVAGQGQTTLSAAVYAPEGQTVSYAWSWCPLESSAADGYECPLGDEELAELGVQGIDFELGTEAEVVFENPFTEAQVLGFCEAIQEAIAEQFDDPELARFLPVTDCSRGYEISVRLEVSAGEASIVSSKSLTLSTGGENPNTNPVMMALEVRPEDPGDLSELRDRAGWEVEADAAHDDQWVAIPEDTDLRVASGVSLELRAVVSPESVETYRPPIPEGAEEAPPERQEAFVFRYFTTSGTLGGSRRLFVLPDTTLEEAPITTLVVSSNQADVECQEPEAEGCGVRLWSVVRDARLGVDFMERRLLVVE
ncbi:hypothetical protein FRC96_02415 [Lujinxingia vulgaris]|uniref:Uncharacterized protein n=1 Tax=Lujinxingia vulgaris TaxID=2600176 RepID=A0A5C6XLA4_9DELT|nr:hypothetical protein [Lujinxingia vulgaris]TXD42759.1 hypothetical protein FRC96_02415 [Lujinxingia vulgaris]